MKSILFKEMDKRYVKPGTPGAKRGKRGGWYVEEPKLPTKKKYTKGGLYKIRVDEFENKNYVYQGKDKYGQLVFRPAGNSKKMNLI